MIRFNAFVRDLRRDTRGAAIIETAFTAPILAIMALGAYDVSMAVSRQTELQNAASEAVEIAIASPPDTSAKQDTLKSIVMTTTGLPTDKVVLTMKYRCGVSTTLTTNATCDTGVKMSTYVELAITDTYTPMWTSWGVGRPVTYNVTRRAMIS